MGLERLDYAGMEISVLVVPAPGRLLAGLVALVKPDDHLVGVVADEALLHGRQMRGTGGDSGDAVLVEGDHVQFSFDQDQGLITVATMQAEHYARLLIDGPAVGRAFALVAKDLVLGLYSSPPSTALDADD